MVMPPDDRQPQSTIEDSKAYLQYREAGGTLGYQEWFASGKPTATEETASSSWLSRLGAYLMSQMDQGFITEAEADLVWDDMVDRTIGQGKYVGMRQTVLDLPSSIRNDVESYWKGLSTTAQKEAEQAVKYEEQKAQDIASQRAQLPLYAGGTREQQILAGQRAINNLRIQLDVAPDYLQDKIRGQIGQLEQGVNQLRENINLEARISTQAEEKVQPKPEILPNTKAFAEKYGMSPGAAAQTSERYSSYPESEEFANLSAETRAEMSRVVGEIELSNEVREPAQVPFTTPGFDQVGATGPPAWKSWFEQNYPSIVNKFSRTEEPKSYEGWNEFLQKERTRLKEEFASRSPYSRGERPGAFQPRIKTVQF